MMPISIGTLEVLGHNVSIVDHCLCYDCHRLRPAILAPLIPTTHDLSTRPNAYCIAGPIERRNMPAPDWWEDGRIYANLHFARMPIADQEAIIAHEECHQLYHWGADDQLVEHEIEADLYACRRVGALRYLSTIQRNDTFMREDGNMSPEGRRRYAAVIIEVLRQECGDEW